MAKDADAKPEYKDHVDTKEKKPREWEHPDPKVLSGGLARGAGEKVKSRREEMEKALKELD